MRNPETNPISLLMNTISNHYIGLIAFLVIATSCYLFIIDKTIPDALEKFAYIVLAFLFGTKVGEKKKKTEG